MAGYTRIPNDHVFNHPLWKSGTYTKAMAMAHLYYLAFFKKGIVEKRGIIISLKPGQIGYSMKTLASMWNWSYGKVKRFLDYLENDGQIEVQKTNVSSTITLLNYVTDDSTHRSTNNSVNGNQTETKRVPINIEKIDKNRKEGKESDPTLELHKHFTGKDDSQPNKTEIEIYRTALKTKSIDEWSPYTKERLRKQKSGKDVPAAQFFFTIDYTKFEPVHGDHMHKKKTKKLFCPKCKDSKSVPSGKNDYIKCDPCDEILVNEYELPFLQNNE
mgnify:CR=1 FL=1